MSDVTTFATLISLFGYMANDIRPQPCDTRVEIVKPNTFYLALERVKESEYFKPPTNDCSPFYPATDKEWIELKRHQYACENSGTVWDGREWEVHTGYSQLTNTRYFW